MPSRHRTAPLRHAAIWLGAFCLLNPTLPARAIHLVGPDQVGLRTAMPREGLLAYESNPASGRFGDEWTGWIDVRHPSLAGPRNTARGYDRSDRSVSVRTTILTDNTGAMAPDGRVTDFNMANKAYVYQAGVSVLETGLRGVTSPAAGRDGSFAFPLSLPAERQIMTDNNAAAPTIDLYYANRLASGGLAEAYYPSLIAGPKNEAIFKGENDLESVFPHELYHFLGDGRAVHREIAADPAHSRDPANIVRVTGQRVGSIDEIGPVLSATVGGKVQITSPQVERIFSAAGTTPFFPAAQRGNRDAYGDKVDWNFVADHSKFTNDGKVFGLEGVGSGVDNHLGVDSLFWGIGSTVAVTAQPPTADNGGKDQAGLGVFSNPGDFADKFFRRVDVFSLATRYADSDVGTDGRVSLRESALDYMLFFLGADGSVVPGELTTDYIGGWTYNSLADNYLGRWRSPIGAVGVFIFGLNDAGHDGTVQIDAVIAAPGVTEPGPLSLSAAALWLLAWRRRRTG